MYTAAEEKAIAEEEVYIAFTTMILYTKNRKKVKALRKSLHGGLLNLDRTASIETSGGYGIHCHIFYEIYYYISGDVRYLVEGQHYTLTPHSILLMAPGVLHGVRVEGTEPYERYACHFMPEILPESVREPLLEPFHRQEIFYAGIGEHRIDWFLDAVLECRDIEEPLQRTALEARMVSLLAKLQGTAGHRAKRREPAGSGRYNMQEIISHINANLTKEISLPLLSERFYISPNHLNRLFREATGTTVTDYIHHKRIHLARQLMARGQGATEAALHAGFQDYSTFYRIHKKLAGCSPSGRSFSDTISVL